MTENAMSVSIHGTANPGANKTFYVVLSSGREAFHKTFSGVSTVSAQIYNHHPDEVPLQECAAWRLALALGPPYSDLVAPCVLRTVQEPGALVARKYGDPLTPEPYHRAPAACLGAALFDCLIGQQDRHGGNYRWNASSQTLGLIDHGFAFALPGHFFNASVFVERRWASGQESLTAAELVQLQDLLASGDVYGLADVLEHGRAGRVGERAQEMLVHGRILTLGEF